MGSQRQINLSADKRAVTINTLLVVIELACSVHIGEYFSPFFASLWIDVGTDLILGQ